MKIASFNVNSIRARMGILTGWLAGESPDVVCLQETKVDDDHFPVGEIEDAGYSVEFSGEKSYNGVAVLSRLPLSDVGRGLNPEGLWRTRFITASVSGVTVVNTYAPQGYMPGTDKFAEKLDWYNLLYDWFNDNFTPADPVIWVGDFNIAPEPRDVYDPEGLAGSVGFHPDEHAVLERIREWGFVDVFRLHQDGDGLYTFWDYRIRGGVKSNRGWRVDHIWATAGVAERSTAAWVDVSPRLLEKPSDHTPIIAEFDI